MQDEEGVVAERFLSDSDASSIPQFLRLPAETPDDWAQMTERFRLGDPARAASERAVKEAREAQAAAKSISVFFVGFYAQPRNWMGCRTYRQRSTTTPI